MRNYFVSFIVPCFNSENTVEICVNSILGQLKFDGEEIIIINDGSTDNTLEIINQYKNHKNVIIKTHDKNMGLAAARNTGIQNACGEILIFIDSDMEVKKDWLSKAMAIFKNKNIVGVMGQYAPVPKTPLNKLDQYLYSSLRGAKKKYVDGDAIPFQYFLFSNTAIRKSVFDALGGFDEKFKEYGGEDTELAIRLYELYPGGLYYYSTLITFHHSKKDLREYCENLTMYGAINLHQLIIKHPQYAKYLGGGWLTSIYGYLIFNDLIMGAVNYLLFYININILIKYKIAYSMIRGYRLNIKK